MSTSNEPMETNSKVWDTNEFQHGSGSLVQGQEGNKQVSTSSDQGMTQDTRDYGSEDQEPILPMLSDEEILQRVLNNESLSARLITTAIAPAVIDWSIQR